MKKIILSLCCCLMIATLSAQVGAKANISAQPVWGPVGYKYVEYYYIPACEVYYSVPTAQYIYYSGGNWIFVNSLPPGYYCDVYSAYKVVVKKPKPWLHHNHYVVKYKTYVTSPPRQVIIKESNDPKYYVVKDHPKYQPNNSTGSNNRSDDNSVSGESGTRENDNENVKKETVKENAGDKSKGEVKNKMSDRKKEPKKKPR